MAGAFQNVNPALATQLRRAWELLDSRWNQWVMGYSRSKQFDLLRQLGVHQPDWADLAKALMGLLSAAALAGAAWAWLDRRRQDPWLRQQGRLARRLQQAGIDALPHHPPRTLAAMVRQHHGAAGETLAQALEALDQQRYAPGGQRLPDRHCWAEAEREATRLRGAPGSTTVAAAGAPG
ncbi:MAG: hypothetical protein CFE45_38695 [Burkholderiales bacterium PBB5]|nr:MAG: hypothetical protein CFE45_38695 [Burkholderiales bacterium PBB5]